jgi:FkbM family methyltransferase
MRARPLPGFLADQRCLERLARLGFRPQVVVDVGASNGPWAATCATVYPSAEYFLIEPQAEFARTNCLPAGVAHHWIHEAVGARNGSVDLLLPGETETSYGGHILPHRRGPGGRSTIVTPLTTLDDLVASGRIRPPQLLKLDVQGYEHEVLAGAARCLAQVEVVFAECSLLSHWPEAPLLAGMIERFARYGFVIFDTAGEQRLPGSEVLSQLDLVLVRHDSPYRSWSRLDTAEATRRPKRPFKDVDRQVFRQLRDLGFAPHTVFDVGASDGSWTLALLEEFPDLRAALFEPLAKLEPAYDRGLQALVATHPRCSFYPSALGRITGTLELRRSSDPTASTTLPVDCAEVFSQAHSVRTMTMDDAVRILGLPYPDLIKIDTQGSELEILRGASECLRHAGVLHLETWFERAYGPHTPLLLELAAFLNDHAFSPYDLGDAYRDTSGTLVAQDVFFVRADLPLGRPPGERHATLSGPPPP